MLRNQFIRLHAEGQQTQKFILFLVARWLRIWAKLWPYKKHMSRNDERKKVGFYQVLIGQSTLSSLISIQLHITTHTYIHWYKALFRVQNLNSDCVCITLVVEINSRFCGYRIDVDVAYLLNNARNSYIQTRQMTMLRHFRCDVGLFSLSTFKIT